MSLRWNLENCENWRELHEMRVPPQPGVEDEKLMLRPFVSVTIDNTIIVDMGEITEDNYEEFYKRTKFLDRLNMSVGRLIEHDEDGAMSKRIPNIDEIKRLVGLTTNVVTEDREYFLNRCWRMMEQEGLFKTDEGEGLDLDAPPASEFDDEVSES
jgi:hypothetical protein